MKSYLVDTVTMLAVYDPAYALILQSCGADQEQTASAVGILSVILTLTARPFGKYILDNWRKYWGTK